MVGAELGKTASETFPRDSLDFNALTSAFKTPKPIRSSGRCQPLAGFGRTYERFPLGPKPCWILPPTALPVVLTANQNNPAQSEGPRGLSNMMCELVSVTR
jgi:hypothetical protein